MIETAELISRIEKKLGALEGTMRTLRERNNSLDQKLKALNSQLEQKDQRIAALEKEKELYNLARSVSGDHENNAEAGKKINALVREIDKCMALLNK